MKGHALIFLLFVWIGSCLAVLGMSSAADELEFTHDFETGDLRGWTIVEGEVFDFQPTFGDNSAVRGNVPSGHEGDWWFGGYEKYQGPDIGKEKGQQPGDVQTDRPKGILESIPFRIIGEKITFLIGGGNHPWETEVEAVLGPTCVNLEIDGEMARTATGPARETMQRETWDVSDLKGETAVIRLYDLCGSNGMWGHFNFDDVNQIDANGKEISWERILLAVESADRLPAAWGAIKRGH